MELRVKKKFSKHPARILVTGFVSVIVFGALLLSLPIATKSGTSIGLLDAFFTASTSVCITGLVVVDTGTTFSLFGQIIILILIQIGALGFMTLASLGYMIIRKRITLSERLIIKESLNQYSYAGLVALVRRVLMLTFIMEGTGAVILSTRFIPVFGWVKGIYFSIFHAVSAFCNAGIDLMGNFQSLSMFKDDVVFNFTIMALIVVGGLGFVVITDIYRKRSFSKLNLHSKAVLSMTALLIILGTLIFYIFESSNPNTLGSEGSTVGSNLMGALFQSVTTRTAGFNMVDQSALSNVSKLLCFALMFIGTSPASTGGGIKTTTAFVLFKSTITAFSGSKEVNAFGRRIAPDIVFRALAIVILSIFVVFLSCLLIFAIESGNGKSFDSIIFEVISAFGTVGLSEGITPTLMPLSKIVIMITMFVGRLGPLTLIVAMAIQSQKSSKKIHYPEDRLLVG